MTKRFNIGKATITLLAEDLLGNDFDLGIDSRFRKYTNFFPSRKVYDWYLYLHLGWWVVGFEFVHQGKELKNES